MTELTLKLPSSLRDYVEFRTDVEQFGTPAEYVFDLIRKDQATRRLALEQTLLDALDAEQSEWAEEDLAPGRLVASIKARRIQAA